LLKLLVNDLWLYLGLSVLLVMLLHSVSVYTDVELQSAANELSDWTHSKGMLISAHITKEIIIHFNTKGMSNNIMPLIISDEEIEHVKISKLLGVLCFF
jgi:hypothetical protein